MTATTRAIILSDLPAAEAREIFDRFVAGEPERLATFLAEVRRRNGPVERLDQSLESLEALWRWFLAEHRPRRWFAGPHRMPSSPVSDAGMRNANPPWWYDHHPSFGQQLGPYLAQLVAGLAAYVFACALRASPSSRWKLGTGRSMAHFQSPVFELEGRGQIGYASPISIALLALRGERSQEPDALRTWLEQWLGMDPVHEAELRRLARPLATYFIEAIEGPRFTHQVSFDGEVAQRQERRIARLAEALGAESGIEDAVHEDREVVLVRAPGLSAAELDSMVASIWKWHAGRSHARQA